jgi:hypothetical protein
MARVAMARVASHGVASHQVSDEARIHFSTSGG